MIPVPDDVRAAFLSSSAADVRAEVMHARRVLGRLGVAACSVTDNGDAFARRSASLECAATPEAIDMLSRPGVGVRVSVGIGFGGTVHWVPVHWGCVFTRGRSMTSAAIDVTSTDMFTRLKRARFLSPRASTRGSTVPLQIFELARERIRWAGAVDESHVAPAVAPVTWDTDRDKAIEDLAASAGLEAFWRPTGDIVVRPVRSITMRPDAHIRQGVSLADASWTQSSETVINAVRAHSDSSNGAGFSGVSIDADPTSPTFVDGEFDMNVAYYSSELFTSNAQCRQAALAQRLLQSRNVETVEVTCALMPWLETGDRINVSVEGRLFQGVATNISFDCFGASMMITLALAKAPEGEGELE